MKKIKNFWLKTKKCLKVKDEYDYDKDILDAVKKAVRPAELTASNFDSLSRWFYIELYIIMLGAVLCLPKPDSMSVAVWFAFVCYFAWSTVPFIKNRKTPAFGAFFQGKPAIVKLWTIHLVAIAATFLLMTIHFGLLPKELPQIVNSIFLTIYIFVYLAMSLAVLIVSTGTAGRRLIERFNPKK